MDRTDRRRDSSAHPPSADAPVVPATAGESDADHWPAAFRALVAKRRTLMLQGPMGGFFSKLAALLQAHGQQVTKVHFNGGDQLFWRHRGALRFTGRIGALDGWLRELVRSRQVDAMVLFGQMRPIHQVAREVARHLGVEVFVFEEGYLRPDYVTIERRGVNALSRLPRLASFYRQGQVTPPPSPEPTRQTMWRLALIAAAYGTAFVLAHPRYRHVPYHRSMNPVTEPLRWLRGWLRRPFHAFGERSELQRLTAQERSKRWFLVALQVDGDSQVTHHSRFDGMRQFLDEVVASFAEHAPADTWLVVKHHPMDRAYHDYGLHLRALARRHGLGERLRYVHDSHLPTLLRHARGLVTVNSTVGLQALYHRTPVITLGDSVYQIPGLVHGGALSRFWTDPGQVDLRLYARFRAHLIASTQLNASFYGRMPALRSRDALRTTVRREAVADTLQLWELFEPPATASASTSSAG